MKILFLLVLCFIGHSNYLYSQCQCSQVLTETDCLLSQLKCNWNSTKSQCASEIQTVQVPKQFRGYCDQFSEESCTKPCNYYLNDQPEPCEWYQACQWYQGKCSHFTGCTAFQEQDHIRCLRISSRCITDGYQCVEFGPCDSYKTEIACLIDINAKWCFWDKDTTKCRDSQKCEELPKKFTEDYECDFAMQGCVSSLQGGCQDNIANQQLCQNYVTVEQCTNDGACIWSDLGLCIDQPIYILQCQDYVTAEQCRNNGACVWSDLGFCIDFKDQPIVSIGCQSQVTEESCIYYGPCIWRGSQICDYIQCQDYTTKVWCTDDSTCFWSDFGNCVDKVCSIAPKTFTTNKDCQSFLYFCITKDEGGCMENGRCQEANTLEACEKDLNGVDCFWTADNGCVYKECNHAPTTLTSNKDCNSFLNECFAKEGGGCRNKECQDLSGTTHYTCLEQIYGCTVGPNSKCVKIKNCEDTTLKEACIEGLNGPCLWIDSQLKCTKMKYCEEVTVQEACLEGLNGTCLWIVNQFSDKQPQGRCYRYDSCQSIKWNTDQQCKQISPFCTTDGTKCVPITKCSETNTNGGCVTGNDGYCIQTVTAINDTKIICKSFDSCSSAYYLKHEECQSANKMCTSNGLTGCTPLADCTAYKTQESCQVNSNSNPCSWNQMQQICRDSICSDYIYSTHLQCNSIETNLKFSCTSDGQQCLAIASCATYSSQSVCQNAKSKEDGCIWSELDKSCKVKQCSDISAPSLDNCSLELGNCTFDGNTCIQKQYCCNYLTKIACNTIGLDGFCYQSKSGKCQPMINCESATEDQQACEKANENCYWSSYGQCKDHDCESYKQQHGTCTNFQVWGNQPKIFCQQQEGGCQKVDPITLKQLDCYNVTNYLYTWNPTTSKCQMCNSPSNVNSTPSNSCEICNCSNPHKPENGSHDPVNPTPEKSSFFLTYFVLFILTVQI